MHPKLKITRKGDFLSFIEIRDSIYARIIRFCRCCLAPEKGNGGSIYSLFDDDKSWLWEIEDLASLAPLACSILERGRAPCTLKQWMRNNGVGQP